MNSFLSISLHQSLMEEITLRHSQRRHISVCIFLCDEPLIHGAHFPP